MARFRSMSDTTDFSNGNKVFHLIRNQMGAERPNDSNRFSCGIRKCKGLIGPISAVTRESSAVGGLSIRVDGANHRGATGRCGRSKDPKRSSVATGLRYDAVRVEVKSLLARRYRGCRCLETRSNVARRIGDLFEALPTWYLGWSESWKNEQACRWTTDCLSAGLQKVAGAAWRCGISRPCARKVRAETPDSNPHPDRQTAPQMSSESLPSRLRCISAGQRG